MTIKILTPLFTAVFLLIFVIAGMISFHKMVLDEEVFLLGVHGEAYTEYVKQTGRYFFQRSNGR
jgi:protein-S-isoprenylcysteine O-methyltransferase Ste14